MFSRTKLFLKSQYFLYLIFLFTLIIANIALCITESYSTLTILASMLIPVGVYGIWLALKPKPGVMMLIAFPIMIFNAFQLVLIYLFGGSVIAVDMFTNLLTTTASEAGELLGNIMPAVIAVCVIYIPMIILAVRSVRIKPILSSVFRRYAILWSLAAIISGGIFGGISCASGGDFGLKYTVFPVNVFYNISITVDRWEMSNNYPNTSKGFTFDATKERKADQREIYVMVIGEASRAANWSLYGYERETNPRLKSEQGLVVFTDALTQNNATHKSVPIILSAASAENFEDLYKTKSFITAFKEAGFRTLFISNQVPNRSFIDYFGEEADQLIRLDSTGGNLLSVTHFDGEMLPFIKSNIEADSSNLLIVLHTYGSHFNFRQRYPESDARFLPDLASSVDKKNRAIVVNSYDNSIMYTDKFLSEVISLIDTSNVCSALLYSSDHGEDLMDDRRGRFLHASPTTTYYQLHIAYLGWFSENFKNAFSEKYTTAVANRNKPITTSSVFHTMLDMADIKSEWLNPEKSVVNPSFKIAPQMYLNDHYKAVPYQETGLTELDLPLFKNP